MGGEGARRGMPRFVGGAIVNNLTPGRMCPRADFGSLEGARRLQRPRSDDVQEARARHVV